MQPRQIFWFLRSVQTIFTKLLGKKLSRMPSLLMETPVKVCTRSNKSMNPKTAALAPTTLS